MTSILARRWNEPQAKSLAAAFTAYLNAARDAGFSDCTPGRFLLPGDLAGSPVLTFAPLAPSERAGRGTLWREFERRFEAYKRSVVKPFFRDHFARIDRQIVLVDVLGAIHAGPAAVEGLRVAMADLLGAFRPGRNAFLSQLLMGKRVEKILFAATKADHLHHHQHARLTAITESLLADAKSRADFAGAETAAMSIAALRATTEDRVTHDGRELDVVRGQLVDGGKRAAFYPGELPDDPARLLSPARQGAAAWLDADYSVMRFAPQPLEARPGDGPPHIRLDKAAQFLIGDPVVTSEPNTPTGPVLIEIEGDGPGLSPSEAPPVIDAEGPVPTGAAMQTMAALATRRPSALTRWFWRLGAALVTFMLSVAAWNFVTTLVAQNAILGYVALGLLGAFLLVCLAIIIREWAALAGLARIDALHSEVAAALSANDLPAAHKITDRLLALYAGRPDLRWARDRIAERRGDTVDADALFDVVERDLMGPLDAAARREVEVAARQVATVTALVPLAFADVIAALTSNLRMIRRIAEIYGGRSGVLGGWRLTRTVLTHLVATGAVAVGDDLIGSVAGGGVLSRISRRFGEGVINGALTARVGVAAIEVCRPLPFRALKRPSVTSLIKTSLTGLFSSEDKKDS